MIKKGLIRIEREQDAYLHALKANLKTYKGYLKDGKDKDNKQKEVDNLKNVIYNYKCAIKELNSREMKKLIKEINRRNKNDSK